jgi:hypothetical protein
LARAGDDAAPFPPTWVAPLIPIGFFLVATGRCFGEIPALDPLLFYREATVVSTEGLPALYRATHTAHPPLLQILIALAFQLLGRSPVAYTAVGATCFAVGASMVNALVTRCYSLRSGFTTTVLLYSSPLVVVKWRGDLLGQDPRQNRSTYNLQFLDAVASQNALIVAALRSGADAVVTDCHALKLDEKLETIVSHEEFYPLPATRSLFCVGPDELGDPKVRNRLAGRAVYVPAEDRPRVRALFDHPGTSVRIVNDRSR